MAHLLSYVCESAEWGTVNTGNNDNISIFDRTVRQSNQEPVKLWHSDSHCQDEWHTTPRRPTVCNHGHFGDSDNWIRHLDHLVLIIPFHEEGRCCRTSPTYSPTQCWRIEMRRTSELTDSPAPSIQAKIDIRLQRFREVILLKIVDLAVCTNFVLSTLCTHTYVYN